MNAEYGTSRKQKRLLKQVDNDLKAVLGMEAGRRFLMRLIDQTGVFSHMSDPVSEQAVGRRAVGLTLVEHIERVTPGAFAALQAEAVRLRQEFAEADKGQEENV